MITTAGGAAGGSSTAEPEDATAAGEAARVYKAVVAELSAEAEALRERERREVVVLRRRLAELDRVRTEAEHRAALARLTVELGWDGVVDVLWHEDWMTLRAHPVPDSDADPDALDALVAAAEQAADRVRETARRRTFGLGPR